MTESVKKGLHTRFHNLIEKKAFRADDVAAGREFIENYVTFIHYVERLYKTAAEAVDDDSYEKSVSGGAHQDNT